jgi:hypothetical protein
MLVPPALGIDGADAPGRPGIGDIVGGYLLGAVLEDEQIALEHHGLGHPSHEVAPEVDAPADLPVAEGDLRDSRSVRSLAETPERREQNQEGGLSAYAHLIFLCEPVHVVKLGPGGICEWGWARKASPGGYGREPP